MVFLHPRFEAFQRVVEAITGPAYPNIGTATVDAVMTRNTAAASSWPPALRLLLPTAKPAAAHRISTSGRSTTSTARSPRRAPG